MFIFSIIFGERYIDQFFDGCLPSLMEAQNIPRVAKSEEITIILGTTERYKAHIDRRIDAFREGDLQFRLLCISDDDYRDGEGNLSSSAAKKVAANLLSRIVWICLREEQVFCHAVPDLVYSAGALGTSYDLHRLTGKVAAIFNGRIVLDTKAGHAQADLLAGCRNLKSFFLENMDPLWRSWITEDPGNLPGDIFGHQIFRSGDTVHIFCTKTNPFVGRFTEEDLAFFSTYYYFGAWDHLWPETLLSHQRLFTQTNLDMAMSVEVVPVETQQALVGRHRERERMLAERRQFFMRRHLGDTAEIELYRRHKFANPQNAFAFSFRTGGRETAG